MNRIQVLLLALLIQTAASAEEINATLDWSQRVGLGLTVSGVIADVSVKPGQRVEKGQQLVALDDSALKARIVRAEAELEEARQNREEGGRELQRATELYDRTVLSDHDLHLARIGEARAQAIWHKAKADLAEARIQLQQSRIQAPFSGLVVGVAAQPGQAVNNGLRVETLVELAQDNPLLARTAVNAEQAARLTIGAPARVEIGGRELAATVSHIGLEPIQEGAAAASPLYALQVSFARPESLVVRAGLPLVIRIPE